MALPDISALDALDIDALSPVKQRFLEIGLVPRRLEPIVGAAAGLHPLLRNPALWHRLRSEREPYAYAARCLMFGDPIDAEELERGLGPVAGKLRDAGLIGERDGGFVSALRMTAVDGTYVWTDDLSHGGQAVMGLGPLTTPLCAAAAPTKHLELALDLGCGAGTFALLVSRFSDRVIATDINPRALALTRFNARLNGVTNLETREGSLFDPVAGERFDVVASQPPFIPEGGASKSGSFMEGGARGDELMLELINALPPHLKHRGRGVVISEWGHGSTHASPPDRVKKAVGDAQADVIVFEYPPTSVETHATEYAAALHPDLGAAFEEEALRRLEHCARMRIDVMVPTLTVVRRVDDRRARFEALAATGIGRANGKRIEDLLSARDVVSTLDSLLDAHVSMTDGVTLREEQVGPGAHVDSTLAAVYPPEAMTRPIPLTVDLMLLATAVHEAATVREGIERYAAKHGSKETANELAKRVAHAMLGGLLVVTPAPPEKRRIIL